MLNILEKTALKIYPAKKYKNATYRSSAHARAPSLQRNHFLHLAHPIFLFLSEFKKSKRYSDAYLLRQRLSKALNHFQTEAQKIGYNEESIMIATYCLTTCLDTSIKRTEWGQKQEWRENPLLKESAPPQERFFAILNQVSQSDLTHFIDAIELMYITLNLMMEDLVETETTTDPARLKYMIDYAYRLIRSERGPMKHQLSARLPVLAAAKKYLSPIPWRHFVLTLALLFVGLYGITDYLLAISANQTAKQLQTIHSALTQYNTTDA